jgi:hypothetical protein
MLSVMTRASSPAGTTPLIGLLASWGFAALDRPCPGEVVV